MSILVVGGGLAGLAAAFRLAEQGLSVRVLEAKRTLGGRAGAWRDEETGAWWDHCQHVSLGCCTNFSDFMRRAGLTEQFIRYDTLHFIDSQGQRTDFRAWPSLPAPLHLLPALLAMRFLSWQARLRLARTLLQMARDASAASHQLSIGDWLMRHNETAEAISRFWTPVLVSALSESLTRIPYGAARQVLVQGMMSTPDACPMYVPRIALGKLYDQCLAEKLRQVGVEVSLQARVVEIDRPETRQVLPPSQPTAGLQLRLADGSHLECDHAIVAVPWRQLSNLLSSTIRTRLGTPLWEQLDSGAITAVHLWFDRPIMDLPHAILLERHAQWIFARGQQPIPQQTTQSGFYYQIVISASHAEESRSPPALVQLICRELAEIWAAARQAELLCSRVIAQPHAVFAPRTGDHHTRTSQITTIPELILAGDWTQTGWPATMEGAVLSGYRAAESLLQQLQRPAPLVVPPLPTGFLANCFFAPTTNGPLP